MQVREETTIFNKTRIFDILSNLTVYDFAELIKCIQCVFWLPLTDKVKNAFYESIKEDIQISRVSVSAKKTRDDDYILYPTGARILDEKLVNDVLDWLAEYPKNVNNHFVQGLKAYLDGHYRDSANKMRLSLSIAEERT